MKATRIIATAIAMATNLAIFSTSMSAQENVEKKNNPGGREKHEQFQKQLQAERVGFLTAELSLTASEAEVFWPIYNDYTARREQIMKKQTHAYYSLAKAVHSGNGDIAALTQAYVDAQVECLQINADIVITFKGVIPDEKIAKLVIAEEKFRREQFRKISQPGKGGGHQGGQHGGHQRGQHPGQHSGQQSEND